MNVFNDSCHFLLNVIKEVFLIINGFILATNDEKRFVSASDDGTCTIWSWLVSDKELLNYQGNKDNKQELGEIKVIDACPMPKLKNKIKSYSMPRNVQAVSASPDKAFVSSLCDLL